MAFALTLSTHGKVVFRITSEETGEALPFAAMDIKGAYMLNADSLGVISLLSIPENTDTAILYAFNHKSKSISLSGLGINDSIVIQLKPSYISLPESKALIKDKDITKGKIDLRKFRKWNYQIHKRRENIDTTVNEKWVRPGIVIKAKKNKLNVLKAFGVNVLISDTIEPVFNFVLKIYDISDKKTDDVTAMPSPVCDPIIVTMSKEQVGMDGFRYEFPDPIPLPQKAVIIVEWGENPPATENYTLDLVSSLDGNWFYYGNPYLITERRGLFFMRASCTPYFWEYTQYSIPED